MVHFFRPTLPKLTFLAQWVVFIAISFLRGDLNSAAVWKVALYPLLLFYLIACVFNALAERSKTYTGLGRLVVISVLLAAIDQAAKVLMMRFVPFGSAVQVIPGWFAFQHARNTMGSWVLNAIGLSNSMISSLILGALVVLLLIFGVRTYQSAIASQSPRGQFWFAVALVGVFSGGISWLADMFLRGFTLDFLGLPGFVTADLKDIYLLIGIAAFFSEMVAQSAHQGQKDPAVKNENQV